MVRVGVAHIDLSEPSYLLLQHAIGENGVPVFNTIRLEGDLGT